MQTHQKQAEQFMRHAIALGRQGADNCCGGPFGAVIVKNGEIVGEGYNQVISSNDPTAHGEIVAIRAASAKLQSFDLSGCEIYTSGEPCPMCLAAIYWAHISRIFYGFTVHDAANIMFDDQLIFDELSKPARQRKIPQFQLLADEALAALQDYAANPDRTPY